MAKSSRPQRRRFSWPFPTRQSPEAETDTKRRDDMLRFQYEQVCQSYRAIDDFRGKLLALWPILGGAAGGVALLASKDTARSYLWAVGLFGSLVSIGLAVYEWTQTLRCDQLKKIARWLEYEMGLEVGTGQFLTVPDGFDMRLGTTPSVKRAPVAIQEGEIVRPDATRFSPVRIGMASFIVYVSVILGWIGLFLWGAFLFVCEAVLQLG
jgi:hypothetical protein